MITCPRCGAESEGLKPYCTNCGAPLPAENAASDQHQEPPAAPPEPGPERPMDERPARGTRYAPMTIGGYIGTFLLLCLPIANFILLIVWASGGCKNESKRNLARAILILYGIFVVLAIVLVIALGGLNEVTEIISETDVMAPCRML